MRSTLAAAIALAAVILAGAIVVGQQFAERPSGSTVASPTPTPSPSLTPLAPPLPVSYESPIFAYRVQLPAGFRRSECLSGVAVQNGSLGGDTFTLLTTEKERAEDLGHVARGGQAAMWTFSVSLWKANGMSATELAERGGCPSCDRAARPGERIEPLVLGGQEAARTLVDGEARLYAVRASERMYVIELYSNPNDLTPRPSGLPVGILDHVARTFRAGPSGSIETPTPQPQVPPPAARAAAVQLGAALEGGDVGRLALLITPKCWLQTWFPQAGPIGRAVDPYIAQLREGFADGKLSVKVDQMVQTATEAGPSGLRLFVRSNWNESGRTTRVDLFLSEIDGQWYWAGSRYYMPEP